MTRRRRAREHARFLRTVRTDPELAQRLRNEVLDRYARKDEDGLVIRCRAPFSEYDTARSLGKRPRSFLKVIYDSMDDALAAAVELERLGANPTVPYECHRSIRRKHLHLRTADTADAPQVHERQS